MVFAELAFMMSWEAAATLTTLGLAIIAAGTWHGSVLLRLSNAITKLTENLNESSKALEQNKQDHKEFWARHERIEQRLTMLER